jgi:signal transduction histidine kinase
MKIFGIRTKIILMVSGTLIASMVIVALFIRELAYQNVLNQKMATVDILTSSLVHNIEYQLSETNDPRLIQDIIIKFSDYYRFIHGISFYNTHIVNEADSILSHIGQTNQNPDILDAVSLARPSVRITHSDKEELDIRSIAPIIQGSKIIGAVVLDISTRDAQAVISIIDRRLITILTATVLASSTILFILLRSTILLRLQWLIRVTRQIAAGDYDIQMGDTGKDEIGQLSSSFEQMTSDLKKTRDEIENHHRHLEQRIQDATSQLQLAYEDLKNAQSQIVLNEKMASLGVLIAGIAHELNTPIAAIHNVARNLDRSVSNLPQALLVFKEDGQEIHREEVLAFLEDLLHLSRTTKISTSYQERRTVETLLQREGITHYRAMADTLARLNLTQPEKIIEHLPFLRNPSLFPLAESMGDIAQAAMISESSSAKIQEIIRALKFYAYTDKDKVDSLQINESLQTALVLLRNRMKHSFQITADLDPELPKIACTSEIHQVWTNLLNNACDAIEEMGEDQPGEIAIRTAQNHTHVFITITDNGIGVPKDKMNCIFDPFFTTKDIGKGTGLGLSIVSGIIKKHNGEISVRSRRGHTEFVVSIPLIPLCGVTSTRHDGEIPEAGPVENAQNTIHESQTLKEYGYGSR